MYGFWRRCAAVSGHVAGLMVTGTWSDHDTMTALRPQDLQQSLGVIHHKYGYNKHKQWCIPQQETYSFFKATYQMTVIKLTIATNKYINNNGHETWQNTAVKHKHSTNTTLPAPIIKDNRLFEEIGAVSDKKRPSRKHTVLICKNLPQPR